MNQILSDSTYFKKYLECFNTVFNNNLEAGCAFVKDQHFVYRAVSNNFAGLVSKKYDARAMIGKTDYDIDDFVGESHIAETIREQDCLIKKQLKSGYFLLISVFKNAFLLRKHPIINPETGNFIGIEGRVMPFQLPNPLKTIYKINGINTGIINHKDSETKYRLTERQHTVLFLYLNRYSYTEISSILSTLGIKISATRVNDHLENLKYIFQVMNKDQLIEKAIGLSYHLCIPRKLLKIGTFRMNEMLTISDSIQCIIQAD